MPKIKTPKPSTHRVTSKSSTKSKSKSRSRSVGGLPALDEILDLPDELELARGPLLRVKFPGLNGNEESDDDEPPEIPQTREELRRLYKPFPKLEVYNDDGETLFEGPIQVLDYIHIRAGEVGGQSVEETEQWYGQITYIGAREMPKKKNRKNKSGKVEQEQPDVCLRVAWFYDHGMLDQRTLTGDDRRAIFRDRVVSQHTPKTQCIARCKLAYKPDRDIQHFCQRISCRRWFHASCLEPHTKKSEDWMIDYELPPEEQQLVDIVSSRKAGSSSKQNKKVSKFENSSETEGEVEMEETNTPQRRLALVRQLPPQVRELATSAITRGIESGQGIVGGAYAILQARWLARKVVIEGGTLTREEEEDLAEEARMTNPDGGPRITPRKYLCPSCGDPI
ncbi:hypothetical protein RSOL_206550 [Rhizoctonia solani AG-3 Rhs1AP]|uniref:BAH domain-containing protein n=1 Tax=Rhizoctonia solani AG-3 Rhs1AP TaxID=1086054 RepID=X8J607_9AGAM|nr:hypothetical protein RSOL_206550 [Rhizoctonia solani AG-3 Rhs1AP]